MEIESDMTYVMYIYFFKGSQFFNGNLFQNFLEIFRYFVSMFWYDVHEDGTIDSKHVRFP